MNSGAWVFPGGVLDAADRDAHASCIGLDDAAASARLGLPHGGLDYYIAAVRECFEEAGLLFAVDTSGALRGPVRRRLAAPGRPGAGRCTAASAASASCARRPGCASRWTGSST